ncbi:MAG: glycosyltransferase family 4 protein, partial [Deltaproteobacteria bacterium]|nr:glycosyltransferase family 4 protein [Deltaproteobacteria bacterium]
MATYNEIDIEAICREILEAFGIKTEVKPKNSLDIPAVLWQAPIFDPSGYADEARNFVLQLQKQGVTVRINHITEVNEGFVEQLNPELREALLQLTQTEIKDNWIHVVHFPAYAFMADTRAIANIGRVMFETDRLPDGWAEKCNQMDEIWVPTDFNLETFAKAGVSEDKLVKVPSGIDPNLYSLDNATSGLNPDTTPLEIPQQHGFTFLSVFQWSYRKGWDVLLKAYMEEFSPDEDVCLILRVYPMNNKDDDIITQDIEEFITQEFQHDFDKTPDIIILEDQLPVEQMLQLYAASDAFVLPSRGEGWGRPFMEAMTMELPTIGTRWSGNLEFMNDENSYLVDVEELVEVSDKMEIPFYFGHKWAQPSVEHLKKLMRYVYENRDEAKAKGKRARQDIIENYTWEKVSEIIIQRLKLQKAGKPESQKASKNKTMNYRSADSLRSSYNKSMNDNFNSEFRPDSPDSRDGLAQIPMTIIWEGSQFVYHSLALVNRELCIALAQSPKCELSIIPYEQHQFGVEGNTERFGLIAERLNKPLSRVADFHIRHQWPPKFEPPGEGYWILMQPWEYGSMPKAWLPYLRDRIDEVWVYTNYNRDCYIKDGLAPDKVAVIPLSVDFARFHLDVPLFPKIAQLTDKSFKFLFVGGTIWRKGIDVLLNAYIQSFTKEDDVCLIIKDIGQNSFYTGQTAAETIKGLQSNPNAPEIIYLTETLSQEDMPGLYTACDCLVHPYRGEGFCLPVAEAMACGLPVIVTKGGACDDFCTDDTVYWISASRVEIKIQEETVNQAWALEPDLISLVAQMRHVAANFEEAKTRGKQASEHIRQTLSWENSAEIILERLAA